MLFAFGLDWKKDHTPTETTGITNSTIRIESTIYMDDVDLVNRAVLAYISDQSGATANKIYKNFNGFEVDLDGGLPLKYSYRVSGIPSGVTVDHAVLQLSETADFAEVQSYDMSNPSADISIYHLKTGTTYFYRLNLSLSSGGTVGTTGSFTTTKSPRILAIDGAVNVRDIGGWMTESGKEIKQGLLYRGSELDGAFEPTYLLTHQGREDMSQVLGIKTDLDLRGMTQETESAIAPSVNYTTYAMGMYTDIFNADMKLIVREIFADLANKDNYPIYAHCTYGRDRTGTLCFLLEALLGVSEADIRREYDLSAFVDSYSDLESFSSMLAVMKSQYTAQTLSGSVALYLKDIGVTDEEIASIREIFLGE